MEVNTLSIYKLMGYVLDPCWTPLQGPNTEKCTLLNRLSKNLLSENKISLWYFWNEPFDISSTQPVLWKLLTFLAFLSKKFLPLNYVTQLLNYKQAFDSFIQWRDSCLWSVWRKRALLVWASRTASLCWAILVRVYSIFTLGQDRS